MGAIIDSDILLEILNKRYAVLSKDMSKHKKRYLKSAYDELAEIVKDIATNKGKHGVCGKPAVFLSLDENTVCCSSCHSQFRASEVRGYNYCPKCGEKIL